MLQIGKERQRFTICHEIAHAVLGLPSDHGSQPWWSTKRPLEERLCDLFAVELLLPEKLFKPLAEKSIVSFESLDALASQFLVSTTATGSRFASVISTPIAFVLSEGGKVKYALEVKGAYRRLCLDRAPNECAARHRLTTRPSG